MDLTEIVNAVIALVAAVLTVFVVPMLKKRCQSHSVEQLLVWVDIGVAAAEQLFECSQGQEKKQYVLDFLARQGYDLDSAQVANAVEAAVLKLHASLEGAA